MPNPMRAPSACPDPGTRDASTSHRPFPVAQWINTVYCHKERPPVVQRDILTALAVRFMDWRTGTGFASVAMLAEFCGAARATVQRALRWAKERALLVQTRRGHRLGDGRSIASEWRLLLAA